MRVAQFSAGIFLYFFASACSLVAGRKQKSVGGGNKKQVQKILGNADADLLMRSRNHNKVDPRVYRSLIDGSFVYRVKNNNPVMCSANANNMRANGLLPVIFTEAQDFTDDFYVQMKSWWMTITDQRVRPLFVVAGDPVNENHSAQNQLMAETCSDVLFVPSVSAERVGQERNMMSAVFQWVKLRCSLVDVVIIIPPNVVVSWYLSLTQLKVAWNNAQFHKRNRRVYAGFMGERETSDLDAKNLQKGADGSLLPSMYISGDSAIFVSSEALRIAHPSWQEIVDDRAYGHLKFDELLGLAMNISRSAPPFYFEDMIFGPEARRIAEKDVGSDEIGWSTDSKSIREYKQITSRKIKRKQCNTFTAYSAKAAFSRDWLDAMRQVEWCGLPPAGFYMRSFRLFDNVTDVCADGWSKKYS